MQIFVLLPAGSDKSLQTVEVEPTDSIDSVKQKLIDYLGVQPDQYDLYFNSQLLDVTKTLADCNILKESWLNLVYRTTGDSGSPGSLAGTGIVVTHTTDIGLGLLTLGVALVWLLRTLRRRPGTSRPAA